MAIEQIVIDEMNKRAPLNYDIAKEIAEKFGLKPRSIVASANRNKIAYENKPRVSKSGNPVNSKADLVAMVAGNLALDADSLAGLEKATKNVLETLAVATFENLDFEVSDETDTED